MRNIKISVRRLSVRPDAVKFYETVFFICLSVFLIKVGYVLVKKVSSINSIYPLVSDSRTL